MKWAQSRSILRALWKESAEGVYVCVGVRMCVCACVCEFESPMTDLMGGFKEGGRSRGAVVGTELGKHLLSPF